MLSVGNTSAHLNLLYKILSIYCAADDEAVDLIYKNGRVEVARKDEIIFHAKRADESEYFQLEGITHRFNANEDNDIITTGIYQDTTVITPHFARTIQNQSIFSLQALTDCTYFKIEANTFDKLREQNQTLKQFARAVIEKEFTRNLNFKYFSVHLLPKKG